MQNKFSFFANFAETIRESLSEEQQPFAYQAICEYGIYGILPEDPVLKVICLMAFSRPQRGAPMGNKNAQKKQIESNNSIQNNSKQLNSNKTKETKEKEEKKNTPLNPQEENNKNIYTPVFLGEDIPLEGKTSKKPKLKFSEVYDWETLFDYWEQNKKGGKYKNSESRNRQLAKLKQLTGGDLEFAKRAITFAVDNNYQGFTNGSRLFYQELVPKPPENKISPEILEEIESWEYKPENLNNPNEIEFYRKLNAEGA